MFLNVPGSDRAKMMKTKLSENTRETSTAAPLCCPSESMEDELDEDWDSFDQGVGLFDRAYSDGGVPQTPTRSDRCLEALRNAFLSIPDDDVDRLDLAEELRTPTMADQAPSRQRKRRPFGMVSYRINALPQPSGLLLEALLADLDEHAMCVTLTNASGLKGGSQLDAAEVPGHRSPTCSTLPSICSGSWPHCSGEKMADPAAPSRSACHGDEVRDMTPGVDVAASRDAGIHVLEAAPSSPRQAEQPQCGPAVMHLRWRYNQLRGGLAKSSTG